jgi:hypothetical protein
LLVGYSEFPQSGLVDSMFILCAEIALMIMICKIKVVPVAHLEEQQ